MEFRKVQQVGSSTLIISLPRDWANEVSLKQGDVVTLEREEDGSIRIRPGMVRETSEPVKWVVDADLLTDKGFLSRVITGLYIIGNDTIQIEAKKELTPQHLAEIREVIQRLNGIGIVEQNLRRVVIQSFVDPTKFPLEGMLRRLHVITSAMQDAALIAFRERKPELAREVIHMEDEVDRLYWLVVRQILMAIRDRTVGKKIGLTSLLHVAGNRLVSKAMEKIGDYSADMAEQVLKIVDLGGGPEDGTIDRIYSYGQEVQKVYDATMRAFFALDARQANRSIEIVEELEKRHQELLAYLLSKAIERAKGQHLEEELNLLVAQRAIAWDLHQIARFCSTIAEVTINRTLEQPSRICRMETV